MIRRTIISALLMSALLAGSGEAQRTKKDNSIKASGADMALAPGILLPFGPIVDLQGQRARATKASKTIFFTVGPVPAGEEPPRTKQMVFLSVDGKTAGYVRFPLRIPFAKDCVGRGTGKGCFRMETKDAKVSNTGLVTGKTHTVSEDVIEGFTGQVWVHLLDRAGNPVAIKRAGCYGVNMRQGRDDVWSVQFTADVAGQAARAEIWHARSGCGRDRWDEVLDKAKKGAEIIGSIFTASASQDSTSPTEPTKR